MASDPSNLPKSAENMGETAVEPPDEPVSSDEPGPAVADASGAVVVSGRLLKSGDAGASEGSEEATSRGSSDGTTPTGSRILGFLRDRYLSMDRRMLGVFRIYFGCLLLIDVLRRIPDLKLFYSNDGVLSNHFALYAPLIKPYFSLFTALSTPNEVLIGMLLTAAIYCFYIAGYRTKLFQILAFIAYASLNARNTFLENGGCVTVGLVACWTMFLPLGDRFSIDALRKGMKARRDFTAEALNDREGIKPPPNQHVTLIGLAIPLQVAAIYFFNTMHKHGATWRTGETIHWVLWQNRIATTAAAWLRMHEPMWLSPLMSKSALIIEGAAAPLALSPVGQKYTRTLNFVLTTGLHLGIALLLTLGPFSYVMIALNMLLLPRELFDFGAKMLRKGKLERVVVYSATDAGVHQLARLLARLDTFKLLTFVDSADAARLAELGIDGVPEGEVATFEPGAKRWSTGADAVVDALRSMPFAIGWIALLGNPLGRGLVSLYLGRRAKLAASFGMEAGRAFDRKGFDHELRESTPLQDQARSTLIAMRESAVFILLIAFVIQVSHDNWWLPKQFRFNQPAVLMPIVQYGRLLQGWSMFAPDAPKQDGTVVVDAVTMDGRHIDPFTGQAPDFDAPLHGPWFQSQLFCDYFLKISFDGNKGYREELKRYLTNWQRIENKPPQDRIVSFEVYWVSNDAPPPGSTTPTNIKRRLLLSNK